MQSDPNSLTSVFQYPIRKARAVASLPARLRAHETRIENLQADATSLRVNLETKLTYELDRHARSAAAFRAEMSSFKQQIENLLRSIEQGSRYTCKPVGPEPVVLEPDLHLRGAKTYSQNDEDGVIAYLFDRLGGGPGYFVEFGVGPRDGTDIEQGGLECNSRLLQDQGWQGLYMDGKKYPDKYGVMQERITALNINMLLDKYAVPLEFDLLSIDVDGQDFWIWMATQCFPRVVVVEYNPHLYAEESVVIPMDDRYSWDGTQWYGASLLALYRLGQSKRYVMVYANGVNAFFVRQDLVANPDDFPFEKIYGYRGRLEYHVADHLHRSYQRV